MISRQLCWLMYVVSSYLSMLLQIDIIIPHTPVDYFADVIQSSRYIWRRSDIPTTLLVRYLCMGMDTGR